MPGRVYTLLYTQGGMPGRVYTLLYTLGIPPGYVHLSPYTTLGIPPSHRQQCCPTPRVHAGQRVSREEALGSTLRIV